MHPREELLGLVRDGETVAGAARRLGIPRPTVYSWKARNPAFSDALSDAVRARRVVRLAPVGRDAPPPDRAELMRRLDEQSRGGSTRATELLLRTAPAEPAEGDARAVRRLLALVP